MATKSTKAASKKKPAKRMTKSQMRGVKGGIAVTKPVDVSSTVLYQKD